MGKKIFFNFLNHLSSADGLDWSWVSLTCLIPDFCKILQHAPIEDSQLSSTAPPKWETAVASYSVWRWKCLETVSGLFYSTLKLQHSFLRGGLSPPPAFLPITAGALWGICVKKWKLHGDSCCVPGILNYHARPPSGFTNLINFISVLSCVCGSTFCFLLLCQEWKLRWVPPSPK